MKNEVGHRYGKLVVLERAPKPEGRPKGAYWLCQCDCGNQKIIRGADLRAGNVNSCGCLYGKHSIKQEIGNRYGKLTVIAETKKRQYGSVVWLCQCDCGNICEVAGDVLRNGTTRSCGCLIRERSRETNYKDLTGKKFGKLTVIDINEEESLKRQAIFWNCKCDCGNNHVVRAACLLNGHVQSCGCLYGHSTGELEIQTLLDKYNIPYKTEYRFSDLPTRRYDFAILNQNGSVHHLIEFDGEQHFKEIPIFNTTLKQQQEADNIKDTFAQTKHIKLIRIPYYKRGNITLEDLGVDINEFSWRQMDNEKC